MQNSCYRKTTWMLIWAFCKICRIILLPCSYGNCFLLQRNWKNFIFSKHVLHSTYESSPVAPVLFLEHLPAARKPPLVEQANSGSLQHFHTVPTLKLVQHGFLLGESLEPFSGSVLIAVSAHSQTGVMKFSADSHCSLIKEQGTGLLWPDCRQPLNVALVKWKVSDSKLRNAVPFCLIYFTP